MRKLRITAPACRDLEAISDYFLAKSIDAGDRFVEAFSQKCKYLANFPYIGKSYDQLRPNLRGFSFMGYIIFYQVQEENIEILRVISGYRNAANIFDHSE